MSKLRHFIRPGAGKIAVVRERIDEHWSKELGIVKTDDTADYESKANPWAFVVAVGGPRTTDRGNLIETDIVKGDRVLIAQVGQSIFLKDSEGGGDFVYVLPFEGVLAILGWECNFCGYRTTREEDTCPHSPHISAPSMRDIFEAKGADRTK